MSVQCFDRGEDALASIGRGPAPRFDVAVVGTTADKLSLEKFVPRLRSLQGGAKVPVVALYQLGAGSFVSDVEKELAAQLPKPLRFSELYNAVQQVLTGGEAPARTQPSGHEVALVQADRFLVVDDNEINRFVATEMLEDMGYEVEMAENGAEAVERVKQKEFVVVLMDCQMPVMDGYAATREIRRIEETLGRHQPIVALTAHALSGERERVMAAGMDDYLSKPVRLSSLDKVIRRFAKTKAKAMPAKVAAEAPGGEAEPCLEGAISAIRQIDRSFSEEPADSARRHRDGGDAGKSRRPSGSCPQDEGELLGPGRDVDGEDRREAADARRDGKAGRFARPRYGDAQSIRQGRARARARASVRIR